VFLSLGSDEKVTLECAGHNPGVFWSADEIGKVALRDLVAGETGFDDTRAVVNYDRLVDYQIVMFHPEDSALTAVDTHSTLETSALYWQRF